METTDLNIFETGSGGDISILNDDLLMGESLYNQVYLALFGGNIEASTKESYIINEERLDYWGNSLIWKNNRAIQFNSETEKTIQNTTLNSSGRLTIIQAVNKDLAYLDSIINFTVDIQINGRDNLKISVYFTEKTNQQDRVIEMIYDKAKKEIIINKVI